MIISSVILVIGVGGAFVEITENLSLSGMALAAIVGVVLNLVLPGQDPVDENEMFEGLNEEN